MESFKKCPNGHFYNSIEDQCPYCGNFQNTMVDSPDTPLFGGIGFDRDSETFELKRFGLSPSKENKVCPNYHAYSGPSPLGCPYCGERKVIGCVDMHTGEGYSLLCRGAKQVIKVSINGLEYSLHDIKIGYWVWDWNNRIKSNYCFEIGSKSHPIVGGEDCVFVHCHDEIVIGPTKMTGKEFIKMCDVIIDNQLAIIGM